MTLHNLLTTLLSLLDSAETAIETKFPMLDTFNKKVNAAMDLASLTLLEAKKTMTRIDEFRTDLDSKISDVKTHLTSVYGITEAKIDEARAYMTYFWGLLQDKLDFRGFF